MLKKQSNLNPDNKFAIDERKILKERAAILAIPEKKEETKNYINCTLFKLFNEYYAIESKYINKVLLSTGITKLPRTPDYFSGIMNNHGIIIPILNLKKIFDLSNEKNETKNQNGNETNVLVISYDEANLGILADDIEGLKEIELDKIQENLPTLSGAKKEYLRGITSDQVVILDPHKIINDEKLFLFNNI